MPTIKDQKVLGQFDVKGIPNKDTNVVRWIDMVNYVNALMMSPVRVIMTEQFVASYNSVAMTLTQIAPEELEIDGVVVALNDRVLISGQLDKTQNGIYIVTTLGTPVINAVLTRSDDFDESSKIKNGAIIPVDSGDENALSRWKVVLGAIPFVLDSATVEFSKYVVDTMKIEEFVFMIEGDGTASAFEFTHNLDTMNITFDGLYEAVTGEEVMGGVFERITKNSVKISFGVPLEDGYDLVMVCRAKVEPS